MQTGADTANLITQKGHHSERNHRPQDLRNISSCGLFVFTNIMPEETTDNAQAQTNTADEPVINTGAQAQDSGAATDTATAQQTNQATQKEKTFTQAEVNQMIKNRLPSAVKAEMKKELQKMAEGGETVPDVKELQQQLTEYQTKARNFETKEAIRDFLADARNKTQTRPENMRTIEKLVFAEIEYDDDGQISNLKEAIETVKSEAPTLFISATTQINGNTGKNQPAIVDFNEQMRRSAGFLS